MEARKLRAVKIIERGGVRPHPTHQHCWIVPSQSGQGVYHVELPNDGKRPRCDCKDFQSGSTWCKHILAAEIERGRLFVDPVANEVEPYHDDRDWAAVNNAYIAEKEHVLRYAHELCAGIIEPEQKRGRPRVPLRDVVFGLLLWVYSTKSSRDAMFDFVLCQERGLISRRLHFASLMRHLQSPALTPLLRAILRESALPMRHIERRFAIDATGMSTRLWHRWTEHKWGRVQKKERVWLKVHVICGTDTRIVTDCTIEDVGDALMFPELVENTAVHFHVEEISADGAYASFKNAKVAEVVGAVPYIPVEDRVTGDTGPEVWRAMVGCFRYREAEFKAHYHRRSNVETVFSSVKRKFGGFVRSRLRTVQENELLAKFILHNLRVCTMGFYTMGDEPRFWQEAV